MGSKSAHAHVITRSHETLLKHRLCCFVDFVLAMVFLSFFLGLLLMAVSENDAAERIQVFVIPHSHMDVGWVYTVQVKRRCFNKACMFALCSYHHH